MIGSGRARVLIVASNVIYAAGLVDYIGGERSFECVGSTVCAANAPDMVARLKADVVILDAEIADTHVPTLCRKLRQSVAHPRILIMGDRGVGSVPLTLIRAGIDGYIFKDCDVPELIQAIQIVHDGQLYFAPAVAGTIVRHLRRIDSPSRGHAANGSLTERETHVLELMSTGANNREIAQKLSLSERTVENHSLNLYRKLGVHDRAEAILVALRRGYVPLSVEIAGGPDPRGGAAIDEPVETESAP